MDITDEYWKKYLWAKEFSDAEDAATPMIPYRQFLPNDPQHPRAYIPNYVRWAKRKELNFTCPITGWKETDFFQDIHHCGPVRLVGRLTVDHIVPGALGGLTTDENIQMICEFANTKKGSKSMSNDELREKLLTTHYKLDQPQELFEMLRRYNVTHFKVGNATSRIRQ